MKTMNNEQGTRGGLWLPCSLSLFIVLCSLLLVLAPLAQAQASLVQNLIVWTGKAYRVMDGGLNPGMSQYIDQTSRFIDPIPAEIRGATFIQTARSDNLTALGRVMTFDVPAPVMVYILHDKRYVIRPEWLRSYADTGKDVVTEAGTFNLYVQQFPAGRITLADNAYSQSGDFNMYTPVIVPLLPPEVKLFWNGQDIASETLFYAATGTLSWETKYFPTACAGFLDWVGDKNCAGGSEVVGPFPETRDFVYGITVSNSLGADQDLIVFTVWGKSTDLTQDGCVNFQDMVTVIQNWKKSPLSDPRADITGDGVVSLPDLLEIIMNWGCYR